MKLRTPGKRLASPAIAGDLNWLKVSSVDDCGQLCQQFIALLPPNGHPDVLAVHVYTTTFDSLRAQLENYHREFGLPIILTEFAMTVSATIQANAKPEASCADILHHGPADNIVHFAPRLSSRVS